jgi:hypothetical protein
LENAVDFHFQRMFVFSPAFQYSDTPTLQYSG